jgi:hypothetical protein
VGKQKQQKTTKATLSAETQAANDRAIRDSQDATARLKQQNEEQQRQYAEQQAKSQAALAEQQQKSAEQQAAYEKQLNNYLQTLAAQEEQQRQTSLAKQEADRKLQERELADEDARATQFNLTSAATAAASSFKAKTSGSKKTTTSGFLG